MGQLNEVINGPTTSVRWPPSKTGTSCLMTIVERSNVLIWPLQGQMLSELLILECNSNSRFRVLWLKKTGFLIAENIHKNGFRIRENPGWKH